MASDVQEVISALPETGPCMTVQQISVHTGLAQDRVEAALARLRRMSMAGEALPACYVKTTQAAMDARGAITPAEARTPLGRAWALLRAQRKADFGQILTLTRMRLWDLAGLRPWLDGLVAAGILISVQRAVEEEPAWVLMRTDMGPRVPVVIYAKGGSPVHVWDPNTGTNLPIERPKKLRPRRGVK
jgi:hypothetical protein